MANTKLDEYQKIIRKSHIEKFNAQRIDYIDQIDEPGVYLYTSYPLTLCIRANNLDLNTWHITWAIASPDEKKMRRKVGEYHALGRLYSGQYLPIPVNTDLHSLVDILTE